MLSLHAVFFPFHIGDGGVGDGVDRVGDRGLDALSDEPHHNAGGGQDPEADPDDIVCHPFRDIYQGDVREQELAYLARIVPDGVSGSAQPPVFIRTADLIQDPGAVPVHESAHFSPGDRLPVTGIQKGVFVGIGNIDQSVVLLVVHSQIDVIQVDDKGPEQTRQPVPGPASADGCIDGSIEGAVLFRIRFHFCPLLGRQGAIDRHDLLCQRDRIRSARDRYLSMAGRLERMVYEPQDDRRTVHTQTDEQRDDAEQQAAEHRCPDRPGRQ